jgi:hypothetical protein
MGTDRFGVSGRLESLLSENSRLRHTWKVYNCGQYLSSSKDWIPTAKYFREVLLSKYYEDCSIVVIVLGFNDEMGNVEVKKTKENLRKLCDELIRRGKEVFLCTVPNPCKPVRKEGKRVLSEPHKTPVTMMIETMIAQSGGKIKLGADLRRFGYENYSFNPNYFSSKGYKRFAEELHENITNSCIKVEFNCARKALGM